MQRSRRFIVLSLVIILPVHIIFSQDTIAIKFKPSLEPRGAYIAPRNFEEKFANFTMSKRFKITASQRDSLFVLSQRLTNDTMRLFNLQLKLNGRIETLENQLKVCNRTVDSLRNVYANLTLTHEGFKTSSSKQLQLLSDELNDKAAQLDLLEQELQAREARVNELERLIRRQDSVVKAINKAIKDALLQFNSSDLSVEMRNGKVYVSMNDKILFQSGKSQVQEEGIVAIRKVSEVLNNTANVEIMIEGHTDNVPIKTAQYQDNWDLSVARATAITRLMIEMGVTPKRITASGKAEFSPKASNIDAEGRSKNRRTEIVLIPNLDDIYKLIDTTQ